MEELEKFAKDCEIYHRAMERFVALGITDKEKVIIEMEKEIDRYRKTIRCYEELTNTEDKIKIIERAIADAKGADNDDRDNASEGSDGAGGCTEEIPYIKKILTDELINRITSVSSLENGDLFIYFAEVKNGNDKQ